MTTFTYKLDHDLGFAPNPFFGVCTLACCKQRIRKVASVGDYVVGLAGKGSLKAYHPRIIFWMKISEIVNFDTYWADPRFFKKRPQLPGPQIIVVGDNTYRHDSSSSKNWLQEISMHNIPGFPVKKKPHIETDTSVDRVLIAQHFTYWGGVGPSVPNELMGMFSNRDFQRNHTPDDETGLHGLINTQNPKGFVAPPIDWANQKYFSS